ncbi:hypothetical protein POK33_39735 [Burkholderia cenocepacia]|uniref:hypothetical protein n=1 Tax=Burkholderia cenocepacia TaxID=95486 RepID=UPI0023BA14BA|nr:hypothetical protein [Burkholderia cenocepacia]MDF0506886.1 hypothetical protein [Burkholderia cenocepacia]
MKSNLLRRIAAAIKGSARADQKSDVAASSHASAPRVVRRETDAGATSFPTSRQDRLLTREGIEAELDSLAVEARRGCGMSYELFTRRYSESVDDLCEEVQPSLRELVLELAIASGCYETEAEREATKEAIAASGGCPHTGIDPDCCPCGRHP